MPKLPWLACPCNDETVVRRQTFLGTAGQQMSPVGLFSSAEHRLGQCSALLATYCWLSTPSAALFCQPHVMLQTAHQSLMSCPALEADVIMGHQSNYLVTGTSSCSEAREVFLDVIIHKWHLSTVSLPRTCTYAQRQYLLRGFFPGSPLFFIAGS